MIIIGTNGEILSSVLYHDALTRELQAETIAMKVSSVHMNAETGSSSRHVSKYSDLTRILYDLNVKSGVQIQFGAEVIEVNLETPYVTLDSGMRIYGDIIVGADGPMSVVRRRMDGGEIRPGPYTGHT